MSVQNPREIALHLLQQRSNGRFVEELFEEVLREKPLNTLDRRFCQELTFGIVRWQATLDWLIGRKTARQNHKQLLQNILRLGIYQLFWLDRVPGHAAVHETVELAKQVGLGSKVGFVNAVLRGYSREAEGTRQLLSELKRKTPHLGYSQPEWLVGRWQQRWNEGEFHRLLDWNNRPPKTFARVNTLRTDPASLITQWRQENVEYDFVRRDWFDENLVFELKSHPPFQRLESFQQGKFYVQDPSTLLAVHALAPKPGDCILDLCAAPGGKLTYAAQKMENQGRILAKDTHSTRLKLIEDNCHRLGVSCVEWSLPVESSRQEASPEAAKIEPAYDRILIDAPCSNTGVMRRRVDLRWRVRAQEIERLSATQLGLLGQSANKLKQGGKLVYSTCSLEPEENEQVVRRFLEQYPGFQLEFSRQLTPFADEVDGAYVARLIRM